MRDTIKKHSHFIMPEDGPVAPYPSFIARCAPTRFPGDARYGLIATKRTFRHAVERNRAKRLLRVWIRECEGLMSPDYDYVFIARRQILDTTRDDGITTMGKALKRLKH